MECLLIDNLYDTWTIFLILLSWSLSFRSPMLIYLECGERACHINKLNLDSALVAFCGAPEHDQERNVRRKKLSNKSCGILVLNPHIQHIQGNLKTRTILNLNIIF